MPASPDSFAPPGPEELSAMLPQYEIRHLIAAGGMGAVYAGTQRALDRPVAIKILPPEAARDGESIDRFRTEARAMARLIHPNIPAVYDFDVSSGYCYLVMEFVDGWNVHQLITGQDSGGSPVPGLNPELIYGLLGQVCDALHFAHQRGIIHGDIKPSNLLVTREGVLKLADFGLAQLMDPGLRRQQTDETDAVMGTPEYAAPELWQAGAVMDHRSDIYSLGCVFYEMLTGAPPQGEFPLPSALGKADARVDAIITRCLQPEPDRRWQSAADIRKAIGEAARPAPAAPAGSPGSAATAPVRIVRPPRPLPGQHVPRRRSPVKSGSGKAPFLWLLLLAVVLGACYHIIRTRLENRSRSQPPPSPPPATAPGPAGTVSG